MRTRVGTLTAAASIGLALVVFGASPAMAKRPAAPVEETVVAPVTDWSAQSWTGQRWAGQTWTGQTWTGQTWTGQTWTGQTWTGQTWTGSAWE